ncbi:MAG: type IV pilin-like G/H family protein [Crocosphaera sp.]|nr:type IV pilin-like G/H family protein [Crocosphaera sp.]
MNNTFKAKLIQSLANKKGNKGFTLIELLVVVIIIGVLAAIALPNLLGQVGKARESEAKSTLGAMNRAQQTVFAERGRFARNIAELEVPVGNEKYYGIFLDARADVDGVAAERGRLGATGITRDETGTNTIVDIGGVANGQNGTRDYAAGIQYDPQARTFSTVVCRSNNSDAQRGVQYALHTGVAAAGTGLDPAAGNVTGLDEASVGAPDNTAIGVLAGCDDADDTNPTTGITDEVR